MLRKFVIITLSAMALCALTATYLMGKDAEYIHKSVMKREHTHYTKLDIDFKKEVCVEFYDNGSWFPVYVCEAIK